MTESKKTPLYPLYAAHGAKLVQFHGWSMPLQFTSILQEHHSVRQRAGLFDVSHMGVLEVSGPGATDLLRKLLTNDVARLSPGQVMYSPMCYEDGGTVDDLLVYPLSPERYLLVVNAANTEKDESWVREFAPQGTEVSNLTQELALLALQGPLSASILQRLSSWNLEELKPFRFAHQVEVGGIQVLLSRTGYTGEDGFELLVEAQLATSLWEKLWEVGSGMGMALCGLGARDTLRFEAALPLYTQELGPSISPLEAGLSRFVRFAGRSFVGREALLKQRLEGVSRRLVGLEMAGKGIARSGYPVWGEGRQLGVVTSGMPAPTLQKNLALALLSSEAEGLSTLEVEVRGKRVEARVVPTPFYRRDKKKHGHREEMT